VPIFIYSKIIKNFFNCLPIYPLSQSFPPTSRRFLYFLLFFFIFVSLVSHLSLLYFSIYRISLSRIYRPLSLSYLFILLSHFSVPLSHLSISCLHLFALLSRISLISLISLQCSLTGANIAC
jgi:hypothetical protein